MASQRRKLKLDRKTGNIQHVGIGKKGSEKLKGAREDIDDKLLTIHFLLRDGPGSYKMFHVQPYPLSMEENNVHPYEFFFSFSREL